jgi:hypothetical protein
VVENLPSNFEALVQILVPPKSNKQTKTPNNQPNKRLYADVGFES